MKRFPPVLGMVVILLSSTVPAAAGHLTLAKLDTHRFNYILPWSYNLNPASDGLEGENVQRAEVKFQLSIRHPLRENLFTEKLGLYFAYTQLSFWQMYNVEASSPFRETNYEPEAYLAVRSLGEALGVSLEELRLGYNHQSNGRAGEMSRSWNRLFAEGVFLAGPVQVNLRPWWRIPEAKDEDDNPDLHKYVGYGDLRLLVPIGDGRISFLWRNNLRPDNRGAVEIGASWPIQAGFRLYVQYFEGYGESLLDYDHPVSRVGVGFIFAETQ